MSIIRAEITYSDGTVQTFTGASEDSALDLSKIPTDNGGQVAAQPAAVQTFTSASEEAAPAPAPAEAAPAPEADAPAPEAAPAADAPAA